METCNETELQILKCSEKETIKKERQEKALNTKLSKLDDKEKKMSNNN